MWGRKNIWSWVTQKDGQAQAHNEDLGGFFGFFVWKKLEVGIQFKRAEQSSFLAWLMLRSRCFLSLAFSEFLLLLCKVIHFSVMFLCKDTKRQADFSTVQSRQGSWQEPTLEEFYVYLGEEWYEWLPHCQPEGAEPLLCRSFMWDLPVCVANTHRSCVGVALTARKAQVTPISSGKN